MANVSFRVGKPSFPEASNTGPAAGTSFTDSSGELRTTANSQTIQNLRLAGYILILHNNVVIQDCIINCPDETVFYGISVTGSTAVTGTIMRRCKVVGAGGAGGIATDLMNGVEIDRCDVSGMENGILLSSNSINVHDCYVHDLNRIPANPPPNEPHYDCIQGFAGPYTSWTVNHNTLIAKDTSSINTSNPAFEATNTGITITNNLFQHQGPTSYGAQVKWSDQVTITGNRISVDATYPLYPIDIVSCTNITATGNVNHETGATITPTIS